MKTQNFKIVLVYRYYIIVLSIVPKFEQVSKKELRFNKATISKVDYLSKAKSSIVRDFLVHKNTVITGPMRITSRRTVLSTNRRTYRIEVLFVKQTMFIF